MLTSVFAVQEANLHRTTGPALAQLTVFQPSRAACLALLGLMTLTACGGLWWRFCVIENAAIALACDTGRGDALCILRQMTVGLFNSGLFGAVAAISAVFNLWRPSLLLMAVAVLAAVLGLTLYNTAAASLACGLVILALARPALFWPWRGRLS